MPKPTAASEHSKSLAARDNTSSSQDADAEEEEYGDQDEDVYSTMFRMLSTEEGEPIGDVLKGIQLSLQQQGKIMYKLLNVVERYCKTH